MNRQCKCTDCSYVFDYEDAGGVRENHWLDGHFCERMTEFVQPEDFCSYAKPKEMEVK